MVNGNQPSLKHSPYCRINARTIDGTEITYSNEINAAIRDRAVGDEVVIKVVRGGKYVDITITLTEYVPENISNDSDTDEETFEFNFGH